MPPTSTSRVDATGWSRLTDVIMPVTIVGAILVFVVPVPPMVLDLLLAANLTLAVLVLLTTLSIRTPQEFSVFPTLLLTTTLTRLVLNVATTRLILTKGGTDGLDAAGGVIREFGEFVARDQVMVGAIIFGILVVIQFVVITKGATRISEVAARFMLDGLPGRQMAIDADLHAGLIDQHEAHRRRDTVYRQADFFGAMDGAGKFVRGDAVAGVIIIAINIGAGLFLGMVNHGMPLNEAINVYTKLTIGDGLVSQIPAFLISLAAGLIVTRSSSETDLGKDVVGQLFGHRSVLATSAAFLGLLALTPLPKLPLLALAGALGSGAFLMGGRPTEATESNDAGTDEPTTTEAAPSAEPATDRMEDLLHVDPLELEIGYRLIALADPTRGGDLLDRLRTVRHRVARDLGLIVPQVRIRDEIGLGPHEYRLKIRGTVVGQGIAYVGRLLAVPPAGLVARPDGRDGVEPVTGQPAVWIHADGREVAELAGCRILEASVALAGHFGEIVLGHADELMTREQTGRLLERARATAPALVDEVVPGLLRAGELQRVLQNLLRERVSIRDLETILETVAVHAGRVKDIDLLTEHVRCGLARRITEQYKGSDGRLRVVALSRLLDARLAAAGGQPDTRPASFLGAEAARSVVRAVAQAVGPLIEAGLPPIVLGSAEARPVLKDLTHADLPRLVVLSQREIPRDTPVETLGIVVEEEPAAVASISTAVAVN
ncbi:flagellar biosynthesis protein FlhA [Singulisphaera acidiphila]|uniref:Flagellar biosynthesis pathway, component FlhA n=1 Tax=Singulisphaera acidiphila (strain ATCC BAA-1392 / DSM 18658 / VKM B-2454 / MOB10) TaxID=886293 RepID=L0DQ00_SINAD|nr:flagellar biosynthesis protein FlhA [Singulisphaera acidiphila]AGA31449.1 flagellar biosynthesis pathway, component FlhA [Singulisphaera acidiphila DSM 18658]